LGDFREPGEWVTWTVSGVPAAGTYDVAFRYGAGDGDATRSFEVNGSVVNASLRFPKTSSWAAWATLHVSAALRAGTNTITLRSTSWGNYLNLDYLQVTGGTSVAPAGRLALPASVGGGVLAW
jgi:hypothetical protein